MILHSVQGGGGCSGSLRTVPCHRERPSTDSWPRTGSEASAWTMMGRPYKKYTVSFRRYPRRLMDGEIRPKPAVAIQLRRRLAGRSGRTHGKPARIERASEHARKYRIAPVQLRQQPLHEARGRCPGGQSVVHPLAVPEPFDQSCFTEDSQVPANARLTLAKRLREIGNTQVSLVAQSQQPQPAGP